MKRLFLHRDAYMCQTSDGALFMNIRSEKYFGLSRDDVLALSAVVAEWPTDATSSIQSLDEEIDSIAKAMLEKGLLTEEPSLGKRPHSISVEMNDAIAVRGNILPYPRVRLTDACNFLCAVLRARVELRFVALARIVNRVQRRKSRALERNGERNANVSHLVRVFRALSPFFYTTRGACFLDSFVLTEFLSRYGVYADWVVAMRTRPFGAHSWVQLNGLLLNEKRETAEQFSPILVI
jgi:hypothetical protein